MIVESKPGDGARPLWEAFRAGLVAIVLIAWLHEWGHTLTRLAVLQQWAWPMPASSATLSEIRGVATILPKDALILVKLGGPAAHVCGALVLTAVAFKSDQIRSRWAVPAAGSVLSVSVFLFGLLWAVNANLEQDGWIDDIAQAVRLMTPNSPRADMHLLSAAPVVVLVPALVWWFARAGRACRQLGTRRPLVASAAAIGGGVAGYFVVMAAQLTVDRLIA